jgi:O-antigen/teichoic acid export membrane protein
MSVTRNTIYNIAGGLIPTATAILFIPYLLEQLGNEKFGVLTIIWALIGFVNLFDLGVSRSLTYEMSRLNSLNRNQISSTIIAGLLIAIFTGALGMVLILLIGPSFTTRWMDIDADIENDVYRSFFIIAFAIIPVAANTAIRGTLEGLQRFGAANLNRSIVGTLMFVLPALAVVIYGPFLEVISWFLLAGRIFLAFLSGAQIWRELFSSDYRQLAGVGSPLMVLASKVRQLLSYGVWIAITGIIGPLMTSGDRFIIANFVNVGLMPSYIIPQEGLQKLLLVPAALFSALFPRFIEMRSEDMHGQYWKYYRLTAISMAIVCGCAAIVAKPVLAWWISSAFAESSYPIVIVLCLGIWINSMAQAPYTLLHAKGQPKTTAIFHLIELVLHIGLLIVLLQLFGIIGAAYAWVSRALLDLILLHFAARRSLNKNMV